VKRISQSKGIGGLQSRSSVKPNLNQKGEGAYIQSGRLFSGFFGRCSFSSIEISSLIWKLSLLAFGILYGYFYFFPR